MTAYVKQSWHDAPATDSPITSAALLHLEEGLYEVDQSVERITAGKTIVYEAIWSQSGVLNLGYTPVFQTPMNCNLLTVIVNCRVPTTSSAWEFQVQMDGTIRGGATVPSGTTHLVKSSPGDFDSSLALSTADTTLTRIYVDSVGSGEASDVSITLRFS